MSSRRHRSKWPSHNCSLINWTSAVISARRREGIFRSKEQLHVQRLDLRQPGERDFVLGPDSGHQDRDFVFVGAIERPFVARGEPLDDVHGVFAPLHGLVFVGDHRRAFANKAVGRDTATRYALLDARRPINAPNRLRRPYLPSRRPDHGKLDDSRRAVNRAPTFVHRIAEANQAGGGGSPLRRSARRVRARAAKKRLQGSDGASLASSAATRASSAPRRASSFSS